MNIHFKTLSWLTLALALCSAPVYGCGDDTDTDDEDASTGSTVEDAGGGKGGDSGKGEDPDAGGGSGGKGASGSGGKGGDTKDGGGGDAPDGGGNGGDCEGADGCYSCDEKTTDLQFLNQCSDSQSEVFDNAERIEFEVDGEPWKPGDELPEVP